MPKKTERVFIRGARLSFPALDEPRATMAGSDDLKYQATFLIEPTNPCIRNIQQALMSVAGAMWGDRAMQIPQNPDKNPLKLGNNKEKIPEGYADMLYICARSKNPPELRDANPHILIIDQRSIREKFVAGYKVNGFIDLYPYEVKNAQGITIKSGIAAGLVSVQFAGYADAFSGVSKPAESDYPDCSADVEATSAYTAPAPMPAAPMPAAPVASSGPMWYPGGEAPMPAAPMPAAPMPAAPMPAAPANPWDANSGEDVPF